MFGWFIGLLGNSLFISKIRNYQKHFIVLSVQIFKQIRTEKLKIN